MFPLSIGSYSLLLYFLKNCSCVFSFCIVLMFVFLTSGDVIKLLQFSNSLQFSRFAILSVAREIFPFFSVGPQSYLIALINIFNTVFNSSATHIVFVAGRYLYLNLSINLPVSNYSKIVALSVSRLNELDVMRCKKG